MVGTICMKIPLSLLKSLSSAGRNRNICVPSLSVSSPGLQRGWRPHCVQSPFPCKSEVVSSGGLGPRAVLCHIWVMFSRKMQAFPATGLPSYSEFQQVLHPRGQRGGPLPTHLPVLTGRSACFGGTQDGSQIQAWSILHLRIQTPRLNFEKYMQIAEMQTVQKNTEWKRKNKKNRKIQASL